MRGEGGRRKVGCRGHALRGHAERRSKIMPTATVSMAPAPGSEKVFTLASTTYPRRWGPQRRTPRDPNTVARGAWEAPACGPRYPGGHRAEPGAASAAQWASTHKVPGAVR